MRRAKPATHLVDLVILPAAQTLQGVRCRITTTEIILIPESYGWRFSARTGNAVRGTPIAVRAVCTREIEDDESAGGAS